MIYTARCCYASQRGTHYLSLRTIGGASPSIRVPFPAVRHLRRIYASIVLDIEKTQANIRSIKALLRERSVPVEDHPDDERPVQVAAPLPPALHQLRAPVADFVGRAAEIERLVQTLSRTTEGGAVATISAVHGMGGIGKTELAYVVANRLRDTFPDAHIVVDLQGTRGEAALTTEQALGRVITALVPEAKLSEDKNEIVALYRSLLTDKRILIVLDDARDADQIRSLLPPPSCAMLITSRRRFKLPGMVSVDLERINDGEAVILLRSICDRLRESESRHIAKCCGRLPLALLVAGGLLANDDTIVVANYLERLEDERKRLAALRDPDDPELDVEASLQLSYAALPEGVQQVFVQRFITL